MPPRASQPVAQPEANAYQSYHVYEEPHPTTWDYGPPPGPAPGPQPGGWGYYDEPQRLAPDRSDGFWDSFTDQPPGQSLEPPGPAPYPPQAAQPAPRQLTSHRLVVARPATRRRPGLQGSLVAAVVLLVLACGGGAYAIVTSLTGHAGNGSGTQASGPATSAAARSSPLTPSASPAGASGAGSATASPTPGTTTAPSGSAPSGVPSGTGSSAAGTSTTPPAGSGPAPGTTVAVSPAAQADSAEPTVVAWLGRYFTAINTHDYQAYVSLLDSKEAANESRSDFTSGYGTTTDSAATLTSIDDLSGGGEAANVAFTSHQSAAQSVNDSSCDRWTITVYLEPNGSSYVVVPPPAGYHSSYESC
jgi:hypothetical protein